VEFGLDICVVVTREPLVHRGLVRRNLVRGHVYVRDRLSQGSSVPWENYARRGDLFVRVLVVYRMALRARSHRWCCCGAFHLDSTFEYRCIDENAHPHCSFLVPCNAMHERCTTAHTHTHKTTTRKYL
jgi:hypothetical protein